MIKYCSVIIIASCYITAVAKSMHHICHVATMIITHVMRGSLNPCESAHEIASSSVQWEHLDQRMIDNAVKQWRRRLRSCVAAKGGHFEQMFNVPI